MKFIRARRYACGAILLACAVSIHAQTVELVAGGRLINNVPALEAPVVPDAVGVGPDGAIYVANYFTNRLMRRDPSTGILSIKTYSASSYGTTAPEFHIAANGFGYIVTGVTLYRVNLTTGASTALSDLMRYNSTPCQAPADWDMQFAVDSTGAVWFTEAYSHSICKIFGFNDIRRVAGTGVAGFAGDGGPALTAQFNYPSGLAIDAANNVYVSDSTNNLVRRISAATGIVTTIAGNGTWAFGGDNVPALGASVANPTRLAIDTAGNPVFLEGNRVRRINMQTGLISTLAGNGTFSPTSPDGGLATQTPMGILEGLAFLSNGDFVIGDSGNLRVRRVSSATGIITTVIGNGSRYFCGETTSPLNACLHEPRAVALDTNGDLYISDSKNRRVRRVYGSPATLTTVAGSQTALWDFAYVGDGGPAVNAKFPQDLYGVTLDAAGNLYIAGGSGGRVFRVDKATGNIGVFAGSNATGFSGDGGPATSAKLSSVASVAFDAAGNLYFSDEFNHRVRKVAAGTGIITTVAGNGQSSGALGDGGPATSASLYYPSKVGFDRNGNLLIADFQHSRLRRVDKTTGIITTIAGNGGFNSTGDGGLATAASMNYVRTFAVDPGGNIFLIDGGKVRRIDAATGIINAIPGVATQSPEGFRVSSAMDMTFDTNGKLYLGTLEAVLRITGLPVAPSDTTPPVIQANVSGTAGNLGWYRSDVQVSWTVTDAESSVTSTGCTASSVVTDTAGITFTCTATSVGGTSSSSITIKRDTVAPSLTFGAATPAADASGWNSSDVSIPFTTSDVLSGVYSTSTGNPVTIAGVGAGLTATVSVTDVAGNSATFTTAPVSIDRSAPVITPQVTGTLGQNDWYTSDVHVTWTTIDDNAPVTTTAGCEAADVTADTASVTFTCTATSTGGSSTQSLTLKRDATAPTLEFAAAIPAANAAGWHGGDVSIPFSASDATSGVASTSGSSPLVIAGSGAGLTSDIVVTDEAGNSATFTSPAVSIDRSPPSVVANVSGTLGNVGWYTSDIHVEWIKSDENAPVDVSEGCENRSVTADTSGVVFTCTASSAGGSTTQSVTLKRDATPPQLVFGAASPAPNAVGWHNSDVSYTFETSDALSGVASGSAGSPIVVGGNGPGLSSQVTVTDHAGNFATFTTPVVNIDRSPPTVQPVVSGTLGLNGWFRSDVQVSWAIDESPANIVSSNGCANSSVTADTAGITFTCSVVSGGGNAGGSITIKRDATAPVVTFSTPSPAPNANGWNKANVTVAFTRSDAMSGLASTSTTSPLRFNSEGANQTREITVTDLAGNTATVANPAVNIDKTAPYAEMETPFDGATYGFYANVAADFVCEDLAIDSCTAPVAQGAFINTSTSGSKTFKVTATNKAGLVATHTHTYNVSSSFDFNGFLSPLRAPGTLNVVTRGSLVPLRWRLPDGRGGFVTNPASFVSATVSTFTCSGSSVTLNDVATGGQGLSFDAASGTFTYNWQTDAGWTGCRKLVIKLKDNSTHEARFRLQ